MKRVVWTKWTAIVLATTAILGLGVSLGWLPWATRTEVEAVRAQTVTRQEFAEHKDDLQHRLDSIERTVNAIYGAVARP